MVSMMIEFTSNNHQIEMICFNSFIITRQNDDGGREIISMVPFVSNFTQRAQIILFIRMCIAIQETINIAGLNTLK